MADMVSGGAEHTLTWRRLVCSVMDAAGVERPLLQGVQGEATSGRLFAVMGPSGSGKTTLLNLLAGKTELQPDDTTPHRRRRFWGGRGSADLRCSGAVLLDGRPRDAAAFSALAAFVRQVDVQLATSTVREALTFHALLTLPPAMGRAEKLARVERVLARLGLLRCADTMLGDAAAGIPGVSGGERRRAALGVELVREPAIILLDEPTTGLDSETALQVVTHLASLAHDDGRTVLLTIHQPSCTTAALFDDLLLLAPGGRSAYCGPAGDVGAWLSAQGLGVPPHTSPSDWYLALLSQEQAAGKLVSAWCAETQRSSHAAADSVGVGAAAALLSERDDRGASRGGDVATRSCGVVHAVVESLTSEVGGQRLKVQLSVCEPAALHPPPGAADGTGGDAGAGASACRCDELAAAKRCSEGLAGSGVGGRVVISVAADVGAEVDAASAGDDEEQLGALQALELGVNGPVEAPRRPALTTRIMPRSGSQAPAGSRWWRLALPQARSAPARSGAGPLTQVAVLTGRGLRWWVRHPGMLYAEALQYLFGALFLGSIYPRLPAVASVSSVSDRLATLFIMVTTIAVTAPSRACITWEQERLLLRWELASGVYGLPAFLASKLLVMAPLEAAQVLVVSSAWYWLTGLYAGVGQWAAAMALLVLSAVNAGVLGHLVALAAGDMNVAFPVLTVVASLLLAFAGFVVQQVPVYWAWVGDISFCTYAYRGLVKNEFDSLGWGALLPPGVDTSFSVAECIGLVAASTLATTLLAAVVTWLVAKLRCL